MSRPDAQAPPASPPGGNLANLAIVQGKVKIAKDEIAANMETVINTGEKIDGLAEATNVLEDAAGGFLSTGRKLERKQRWSKYKWYIVCAVVALILCSGIIVAIVVAVKN